MRKLAFFLSFCLLLCFGAPAAHARGYAPSEVDDFEVHAQSVYLYNLDTGTALYQKDEQKLLQPASTAKIMTCILALENTEDLDAPFVYPTYVFDMLYPGVSQADVRVGEEMTMRKALYCLMLQSDCYSALAIADEIGGGEIQAFVDKMNEKAKELGAENTYFANPHGLYDEAMHTTAYDMFLITKYAVNVDGFMDFVSVPTIDIGPTNKHPGTYNLYTTIAPMVRSSPYFYEPITGIKTGTLDEVGRNYISMATKNGYTYLLVLLGAPIYDVSGEEFPEKWSFIDAKNIYEWAFNGFESKVLFEKGKTANGVAVRLGKDKDQVNVVAAESVSALVPVSLDVETGITYRFHGLSDPVDAPVKRGQKLGTVDVMVFNEVIGTIDLLAEEDVARSEVLYILDTFQGLLKNFWVRVGIAAAAVVVVLYIFIMVLRNRNRRRYSRARRWR